MLSRAGAYDGKATRIYVLGVSGYDFTYSYDAMGRFEKIFLTSGGGELFQYYYNPASNETERDNIVNSVHQVYPRDELNRMQYMDVKKRSNHPCSRRVHLRCDESDHFGEL